MQTAIELAGSICSPGGPALKEIGTLGLWVPKWVSAKYPKYPSIGRIEAEVFDPEHWYPEYPDPAFSNRLLDDEFWALQSRLWHSPTNIRAIVRTGQISDPAAENYLVDCLIRRRDKIGKAFLAKVLPLDRFSIQDGELTFEDLAVTYGLAHGGSVENLRQRNREENSAGKTSFAIPHEAFTVHGTSYFVADIYRKGDTSLRYQNDRDPICCFDSGLPGSAGVSPASVS